MPRIATHSLACSTPVSGPTASDTMSQTPHPYGQPVAVVSASGKRLRDFPVETHGDALIDAVRSVAGKRHLVLEEGTQSAVGRPSVPVSSDLFDTIRPPEATHLRG